MLSAQYNWHALGGAQVQPIKSEESMSVGEKLEPLLAELLCNPAHLAPDTSEWLAASEGQTDYTDSWVAFWHRHVTKASVIVLIKLDDGCSQPRKTGNMFIRMQRLFPFRNLGMNMTLPVNAGRFGVCQSYRAPQIRTCCPSNSPNRGWMGTLWCSIIHRCGRLNWLLWSAWYSLVMFCSISW